MSGGPTTSVEGTTGEPKIDIELKEVQTTGDGSDIDPAEEAAVLRKIDLVVLPLMCLVYLFQYLDKQSIGYAAVFGLADDLKLAGTEYSWAISLFYFGTFAAEYPFVYLMSRLPIIRFVGVCIVLWGLMELCLAFPHSFAPFGAVRFLLGFAEGAVSPAFVVITSQWYKRSENPFRVATWVSCNGLAQIIGALFMYAIGKAEGLSMANWRVMFLVCGGCTIACGILFILAMPAEPSKAWFLNQRERHVATMRLALDRASRDRSMFSKAQFIEALTDYTTYFYFAFGLLLTMPSPVIKVCVLVRLPCHLWLWLHTQTMLVGLPAGGLQIMFIWIAVIGVKYTENARCWWAIGATIIPLIGNICILTLPASSSWGIIASTWMATILSPALTVILSILASNVKGNTKKSTVSLIFFLAYSIGCIASPQLWTTKDAPRYYKGLITDIVSFILLIATLLAYRFCMIRENRKKALLEEGEIGDVVQDFDADLTDREDRHFRYTV